LLDDFYLRFTHSLDLYFQRNVLAICGVLIIIFSSQFLD
jgi:hypothetical protein